MLIYIYKESHVFIWQPANLPWRQELLDDLCGICCKRFLLMSLLADWHFSFLREKILRRINCVDWYAWNDSEWNRCRHLSCEIIYRFLCKVFSDCCMFWFFWWPCWALLFSVVSISKNCQEAKITRQKDWILNFM